ncbi:MAG: hypothetical protein V4671_08780 [Armatimonadota bacterium]
MVIYHKLQRFSQTRFGEAFLSVIVILITIAVCTAILLPVYNRAKNLARGSNDDEANGRAIKESLGFHYTALNDRIGDTYVSRGTGILLVELDGPFDKAGLKKDDRILVHLGTLKALLVHQRGKKVVLPVVRAGRRFEATVNIPRFIVPHPELVPSAPAVPAGPRTAKKGR